MPAISLLLSFRPQGGICFWMWRGRLAREIYPLRSGPSGPRPTINPLHAPIRRNYPSGRIRNGRFRAVR